LAASALAINRTTKFCRMHVIYAFNTTGRHWLSGGI